MAFLAGGVGADAWGRMVGGLEPGVREKLLAMCS
jgi:hypothetical protein